ncbi:kinase-like domain-containing protein [Mycena leptocephala]|nr:kinase-like domain-containing protein [Mycena leptocephala]
MTPTELDTVAAQLSTILAEMRACKRRFIGSVSGGPLRNFFLTQPWTPKHAFDSVGDKLPRNASIVLTHGDLRPHNILVQGTTITAVIDWEAAGFYPDYWEYAWMHGWIASPGWTHLLARVFPGARRTAEIDAVNAIARAMDLNGC